MIWEMTVSTWSSPISIWDILSVCTWETGCRYRSSVCSASHIANVILLCFNSTPGADTKTSNCLVNVNPEAAAFATCSVTVYILLPLHAVDRAPRRSRGGHLLPCLGRNDGLQLDPAAARGLVVHQNFGVRALLYALVLEVPGDAGQIHVVAREVGVHGVEAQVGSESKTQSGSSCIGFKHCNQAGSIRGQPGVNLGQPWGQPEVNLGSTWGQPGVNIGSAWGQPGVNLHRPTIAWYM